MALCLQLVFETLQAYSMLTDTGLNGLCFDLTLLVPFRQQFRMLALLALLFKLFREARDLRLAMGCEPA